MSKEILRFDNNEIENDQFYRHKSPIFLEDTDIDKVLVSKMISFGEKTINTSLVTCIMTVKLDHYI